MILGRPVAEARRHSARAIPSAVTSRAIDRPPRAAITRTKPTIMSSKPRKSNGWYIVNPPATSVTDSSPSPTPPMKNPPMSKRRGERQEARS